MNPIFKNFLHKNQIKTEELPSPLQEKISLFWKLHDILKEMSNSENKEELIDQQEELEQQLKELDYEILGDIEEEFEDEITNNDREEEAVNDDKMTVLQNDMAILKQLQKMRRTKGIGRHEFKEMGLQTPLGWRTDIGEFTIKRNSIIRYSYDIIGV